MRRHKYQWLIGALIILVAFAVGAAIYKTQRPQTTTTVSPTTIKTHYQTWQRTYLKGTGTQRYVQTTSTGTVQTLSEAQGYGMLITVLAAKQGFADQKTFDQLTRYYLAHRISRTNPLMAWRQTQRGGQMVSTAAEKTSATDGDLDIAYALILADEHWHSRGDLNYGQLAKQLIRAIKRQEINAVTQLPKVGNWATAAKTRNLVRPSDLITAYFRKFASYTGDGSWTRVAQHSQTTLQALSRQHATGLMADFVTVSGPSRRLGTVRAQQVASVHDDQYGFNACRVPWRVAYDYQLSQSQISRQVVQKMLRFFAKQSQIKAGYTLTGKPTEKYANQAFSAPVAYAAQVVGDQALSRQATKTLTTALPAKDYYPATLQTLMLLQSGRLDQA